jgi:hypothetical protein
MTGKLVVQQEITPALATEKLMKLETLKKQVSKEIEELKGQLLQVMDANNVKSLKTDKYTISRSERQTVKVLDDSKAAQALRERDVEVRMVEVLSDETKNMLKTMVKVADIAGVEVTNTPYVSVRINKE